MLENKLDVFVGERDQVSSYYGGDYEIDIVLDRLHLMYAPEKPLHF